MGPCMFLDWNLSLRDVLPRRSMTHPFVLDCSPKVARQGGTYLKHSLTGRLHLHVSFLDNQYNPTMGHNAHCIGWWKAFLATLTLSS